MLPLDAALATSLNPDPYLALFISGSIVVFFFAESHDSHPQYFLAGLLAGWVFWIKEEVIVFGLVFLIFAAFQGRWRTGWLWFLLGGLLCCVADLIFFWLAYGDPFYHYSVVHRAVGDQLAAQSFGETSPWAYIGFLFIKVYHTGLLGWLALAGCVLALRRPAQPGTRFVLIWGIGLLVIFSLFPVSLSPPEFIRKTATYMEIFVTPLALLAGWFLAQQQRAVAFVLGAGHGRIWNSALCFGAAGRPSRGGEWSGSRRLCRGSCWYAGIWPAYCATAEHSRTTCSADRSIPASDIRPWVDLSGVSAGEGPAGDVVAYLVDDPQMRIWPDATKEVPLSETLRRCLVPLGPLEHGDLGLGRSVVAALRDVLSVLPAPYAAATLRATDSFWQVSPAQVYVVTRECAHEVQGKSALRSPPRSRSA